MALPPFAIYDDLVLRLPAGVTVDEERAEAALTDASALIHAESDSAWVTDGALIDTVPPIALAICCKAAVRALVNPAGAENETTGPFSTQFGDVYLTAKETSLIRGAAGGTGGVWTLGTTRLDDPPIGDTLELDGTEYIAVVGSEPFPFLPA